MKRQPKRKKEESLNLPKPTEDIYGTGFNEHMVRPGVATIEPRVEMSPTMASHDVTSYLNALEVSEYFQITHTLIADSGMYLNTTQHYYKDQLKVHAPAALVFYRQNTGYDTSYILLPYYKTSTTLEVTTSSFFITEFHKYDSFKRYIEITTGSDSPGTHTYDVYILKDKLAQR